MLYIMSLHNNLLSAMAWHGFSRELASSCGVSVAGTICKLPPNKHQILCYEGVSTATLPPGYAISIQTIPCPPQPRTPLNLCLSNPKMIFRGNVLRLFQVAVEINNSFL